MSANPDIERVTQALNSLGEHFDTVHIFATRHEPAEADGTINVNNGVGNWFARYGQVKEWIVREERRSQITTEKSENEG